MLRDRSRDWPARQNLFVEGFSYGVIGEGPKNPTDRKNWLYWPPIAFHPQPYDQLASALQASGLDNLAKATLVSREDARRLYFFHSLFAYIYRAAGEDSTPWRPSAEHDDDTLLPSALNSNGSQEAYGTDFESDAGWSSGISGVATWLVSFLEWIVAYPFRWTIHYGYAPLQASLWIVFFVGLGACIFHLADTKHVMYPTDSVACSAFLPDYKVPEHYQPFQPFVYSFEAFFPLVKLHQEEFWLPKDKKGDSISSVTKETATTIWSWLTEDKWRWAVVLPIVAFASIVVGFVNFLLLILVVAIFGAAVWYWQRDLHFGTAVRLYLWLHITMGWVLASILVVGITAMVHGS
jgi:hypothetical protein